MTKVKFLSSYAGAAKKKRTITGNVTDGSTGEPLIGVSIMLKGSSDGTTTDLMVTLAFDSRQGTVGIFLYRL